MATVMDRHLSEQGTAPEVNPPLITTLIPVGVKLWLVDRFPMLRALTLVRGGLTDVGWYRSVHEGMPVDKDGRPLVWLTYAAIFLLADRVPPSARVFEYGAGNSTLWWAERVREVVACEHSEDWARLLQGQVPPNTLVLHRPLEQGYATTADEFGLFQIVVIDGRERVRCVPSAIRSLAADGIIVWDNTDRQHYRNNFTILYNAGFQHIDFWGLAPGVDHFGCTTVFYREGNCLGL